jgi:uncharacterized membrane protein
MSVHKGSHTSRLGIWPLLLPLGIATALCLFLYAVRVVQVGNLQLWFINWNLLLAWLPLVFAALLVRQLALTRWLSWQCLALTALWFFFLPNSFYLVSDFVHLGKYQGASLLFDSVLLMSYALTGLALGWFAVYVVHIQLAKRLRWPQTWLLLLLTFLLCSFAIYLGRNLGWNSWDIIGDPWGIMMDIVQRITYPARFTDTYSVTALFFVFISGTYAAFYTTIKALKYKT